MKCHKLILFFLLLCIIVPSYGQSGNGRRNSQFMNYIVEGKDTIYLSPLAASHVYEKKKRNKGRQWRKYYKLVYNFARVYPYALAAKDIVLKTDSTIKADNLKYIKKEKYVGAIVKDLFKQYEKSMRNLTISQGQLLMKLIDRECGITSYDIIKDFKNGYAAVFWQGVAKIFGNDLKKPYDPLKDDAPTEELVRQWIDGTFERTYFEIFWKYPPEIKLPVSAPSKPQPRKP